MLDYNFKYDIVILNKQLKENKMQIIKSIFKKGDIVRAKDIAIWTMFYMIISLLTFIISVIAMGAFNHFFK